MRAFKPIDLQTSYLAEVKKLTAWLNSLLRVKIRVGFDARLYNPPEWIPIQVPQNAGVQTEDYSVSTIEKFASSPTYGGRYLFIADLVAQKNTPRFCLPTLHLDSAIFPITVILDATRFGELGVDTTYEESHIQTAGHPRDIV